MFRALARAFAQLSDPATRGVLWRAVAASTAVFILLWALAGAGLAWSGAQLGAMIEDGFWSEVLTWVFGAGSIAGLLLVSFLIFPAVVGLILGFLLDSIVEAVERRHYPDLPAPRQTPLLETLWAALSFAAVTILLNLLALPLYLLLLFVPPFNLFVFYGLNGYLFGSEYFELVALRRLDRSAAQHARKANRGRLMLAGIVIAVLLTIPLINLLAPILATGFMVHIFEDIRRRA